MDGFPTTIIHDSQISLLLLILLFPLLSTIFIITFTLIVCEEYLSGETRVKYIRDLVVFHLKGGNNKQSRKNNVEDIEDVWE